MISQVGRSHVKSSANLKRTSKINSISQRLLRSTIESFLNFSKDWLAHLAKLHSSLQLNIDLQDQVGLSNAIAEIATIIATKERKLGERKYTISTALMARALLMCGIKVLRSAIKSIIKLLQFFAMSLHHLFDNPIIQYKDQNKYYKLSNTNPKKNHIFKMCFSDQRVNSRQIKQSFKQMLEERKKYTQERELSKYTICMLQYMESILKYKVGISLKQGDTGCMSFLPCCREDKNRNVRKQFQRAYQSCTAKEQLDYYRKVINYMTGKQIQLPYASPKYNLADAKSTQPSSINGEYTFNALIKGRFTWGEQSTMRLCSERCQIYYKELKDIKEICLNLRNYILRKSKHSRSNAYVLENIVPIQPSKIRFAVPQQTQNSKQIIEKIYQIADKALYQNVLVWRQPIGHIPNPRLAKFLQLQQQKGKEGEMKPDLLINQQKRLQPKAKKQQISPQVNFGQKSINNPLNNLIIEKAKYGLMKKVKDYNETVIDPNSKKEKEDTSLGKEDFKEEMKTKRNIKKQEKNDNIPTKIQEHPYGTIDIVKNLLNPNNINTDGFKKKSKPAMSQANSPKLSVDSPKRQPQNPNYVRQPEKTQSQVGLKAKMSNMNHNLLSQIQRNNNIQDSRADSGKGKEGVSIIQQQQFGNASQLSQYTEESFRTIPESFK